MTRITDEEVTKLLKDLPRREASSRFTGEVLERIGRPGRAHPVARPWVLSVIVVIFLLGLSIGAHRSSRQSARSPEADRVESLRTEYRELEAELERLRELAREVNPVIELGGTERVDFIFDLREFARQNDRFGVVPVSHRSGEEQ